MRLGALSTRPSCPLASLFERESQGNKYDDRMRDDYIPPNRKMMLLCKQKDKWIAAEEDELRSFAVNNVMTKNPRLPDNGKALPLKWIYTIKKDLKGVIVRYKARLVVQGFFQIFGVDYTDTYSQWPSSYLFVLYLRCLYSSV